jgi:hypothetical protein
MLLCLTRSENHAGVLDQAENRLQVQKAILANAELLERRPGDQTDFSPLRQKNL